MEEYGEQLLKAARRASHAGSDRILVSLNMSKGWK
jgi:hypothetical protein